MTAESRWAKGSILVRAGRIEEVQSAPGNPVTRTPEVPVEFHHLSWVDPVGRLFWYEGNLYRGIREQRATLYRDLLESGIIQELVARRLLIDTWATDLTTDEFPLIVQHRVLPVVSFASEWCSSQLKAAALAVLDLEAALRAHDLTLIDINPWNLLFDGVWPLYVDFSSIAPLADKNTWAARDEFHEFYLNPLLLFGKGLGRFARRLLCDPWVGVKDIDLERMKVIPRKRKTPAMMLLATAKRLGKFSIPRASQPPIGKLMRGLRTRTKKTRRAGDQLPHIQALRDRVDALCIRGTRTPWEGYYVNNFPGFSPEENWTTKHHSIREIIEETKPRTLLDVGSNSGWYSQMAASCGVRVIAADSDESAVNELYANARTAELPIHPVFMDVRFPESAQGPGYRFFGPATHRFNSEMVLALGLVHHLVFTWDLNFDQIVDALDGFSSRWLVVEFVGPADGVVKRLWNADNLHWYRLDNFIQSLGRSYNIISQLPSDSGGLDDGLNLGPDDRTILLCEKRVQDPRTSECDLDSESNEEYERRTSVSAN
jgi:hypothetical protein